MNPKLLTIFTAVVAVTVGYPVVKTWTLNELSDAIETMKDSSVNMKPYTTALNIIMYALFTGTNQELVMAIALSPSGHEKWTIDELRAGLKDPAFNNTIQRYIYGSLHYLLETHETEVEVTVPAQDISTWTFADIQDAMEDPGTNPQLIPYLEKAQQDMRDAIKAGCNKGNITIVTPVGLIPMKSGKLHLIPKTY